MLATSSHHLTKPRAPCISRLESDAKWIFNCQYIENCSMPWLDISHYESLSYSVSNPYLTTAGYIDYNACGAMKHLGSVAVTALAPLQTSEAVHLKAGENPHRSSFSLSLDFH